MNKTENFPAFIHSRGESSDKERRKHVLYGQAVIRPRKVCHEKDKQGEGWRVMEVLFWIRLSGKGSLIRRQLSRALSDVVEGPLQDLGEELS